MKYDAENRLIEVKKNSVVIATFTYDGDGKQVKSVVNGVTTYLVGAHYHVENGQVTKYYFAGAQRVAMRKNGTLSYMLSDHLGSTLGITNTSGTLTAGTLYKAWGETRYTLGANPTKFKYTGQREESSFGLYFYNARWYDASVGRFTSADIFIPEPYYSQSYDRYAYVYNSPVRYTDASGHCIDGITTWACLVAAGMIILKLIDYGWTGYDIYQSANVVNNPNASPEDKLFAGLNVGLAVIFEAGEPDDLLPVGVPLDDVGRKLIMKGAKEAYAEGGQKALQKYLKENLGDYADEAIQKLDELLGYDNVKFPDNPGQMNHIFRDAEGHMLEDTIQNRNLLLETVSSEYYQYTNEFGVDVFSRMLDDGTEVWVEIYNGTIRNGGINLNPLYR